MFYICLASIEQPQNNWLIKTYSFPIGKFILMMLIGEETIEYQSIISIKVIQKKKKKKSKKSELPRLLVLMCQSLK